MNFVIYPILFFLSFIFMGLEMVAARIITPYFGNSIYTWGSIISVFLIGSSLGYWLGGKSADISNHKVCLKRYFIGCIIVVSIIPHLAKMTLPYLQIFPEGLATFLGASILFIVPNALLSAIIPSIIKIGLLGRLSGARIGSYHMISSVGSIMGTLLTTFVLLPGYHVNLIFSFFVFLSSLTFCIYMFQESKDRWGMSLWLFLFCIVPLLPQQMNLFPQAKVIAHLSSPYHELFVLERDSYKNQQGSFRFLQFNKGGYQGGIDLADPEHYIFSYVRNMSDIMAAYHPSSENVFMIGRGIGSLTRKVSSQSTNIEVAEIDEKVLEVSKSYFGYTGNEVNIGDGRVLLGKKDNNSIDVLLLDAYNGGTIPFHLTTQEFFQLTQKKLTNDGIIVMNVIGKSKNDPFVEAISATVASIYSNVKVFATDPAATKAQNLFLVASSNKLSSQQFKESTEIMMKKGKIIIRDGESKFINLN